MGIAERRPCAILQLRTLCRLTENVVTANAAKFAGKHTPFPLCVHEESVH